MSPNADKVLDEIDVAILSVLQGDGRAPFIALARELKLPESTVRLRTRKLLDSGLVSVVATGNPLKLGISVDAISLVRIEPLDASSVADALAAMSYVRYVAVTLGGAALVVESFHRDTQALHSFLTSKLHNVSGIKEVTTFQVMEIRKSVWDWQAWLQADDTDESTTELVEE